MLDSLAHGIGTGADAKQGWDTVRNVGQHWQVVITTFGLQYLDVGNDHEEETQRDHEDENQQLEAGHASARTIFFTQQVGEIDPA